MRRWQFLEYVTSAPGTRGRMGSVVSKVIARWVNDLEVSYDRQTTIVTNYDFKMCFPDDFQWISQDYIGIPLGFHGDFIGGGLRPPLPNERGTAACGQRPLALLGSSLKSLWNTYEIPMEPLWNAYRILRHPLNITQETHFEIIVRYKCSLSIM